jgi:2-polyprenyl-3-methyl-5-hydroxy-6-metoxy-1,4-benzoquinol methylase
MNNPYRFCPACRISNPQSIGNKNNFQILMCRECRSLYTSHLPAVEEAENYDNYYNSQNLDVPDFVHQRLGEIIESFSNYRDNNRLLDFGAGAGTILKVAREKNWQAFGVEVSEPAVEYARKLGFDVFHGEINEANYPDNYFDVVTASEVLEHLENPLEVLKEIARILRPGGLLWATTPHASGLSYRLIGLKWSVIAPPEHLQLYSRKAAFKMLRDAGFSDISLKTHSLNPMEIIHNLRHTQENKSETVKNENNFDRVQASYELNESFTRSRTRREVKNLMNNTLNLLQLGDSLKIMARI